MKVRIISRKNLAKTLPEPWVDQTRRVFVDSDTAYVPVREGYAFDEILPKRKPYKGKGYQKMDDILLLHGNRPSESELNQLIEWENPCGILYAETHEGVMRLPKIETLYGKSHEVTFFEDEISYTLDPSLVMFSQGNRNEKRRLRSLVKPGEKICDMFAGIGYFSLSAAKMGGSVHAIEINPVSHKYLLKNISENNFENIFAELGDCREKISGTYDRILMGHFDAENFLETALCHAKTGTTLHVHGIGDKKNSIESKVQEAGFTYSISEYTVKKYAPNINHSVWDVRLK